MVIVNSVVYLEAEEIECMTKTELKTLVEQVVRQETSRLAGMSKGYMFKEQIMKQVQDGLVAELENIHSPLDFQKAVDSEIEKVKSDMDLTYEMVSRTLKDIPFEIFIKAYGSKPKV